MADDRIGTTLVGSVPDGPFERLLQVAIRHRYTTAGGSWDDALDRVCHDAQLTLPAATRARLLARLQEAS